MIMKKIFTLIAAAFLGVLSVNADNYKLDLTDLGSGWSSSYDAETKTITYDAAWAGRGWWFSDRDFTGYTKVVVETEALAAGAKLIVEYAADDVSSTEGIANAGDTKIEALINEASAAHLKQIYIQSSVAGTITLVDAYLSGDAVDASVIWEGENDFGITWDWNSTLGFAGGSFANLKSGDALVLDYTTNADAEYANLKALFGQWGNSEHKMPSALVGVASAEYDTWSPEMGSTSYAIPLTDEDITTLKSDGLRISGYNLTLTKVRAIPTSETAISNATIAPVQNENTPIYNLAGQQVSKSYKGVVIQNGKKFIQK